MGPFRYRDARAREICFPLGGIGTGCIGLGGAGHLVDWEIFNRPAKGTRNGFSHFAIKAEAGGRLLDARVLHGDVAPPYSGAGAGAFSGFGFGLARETLSGLPHFRHTEFVGGFPLAEVRFRDPRFPGRVTLSAFNPFIPHEADDSSLPAAFFTVAVRNPTRRTLDYTIAFSARNPATGSTTHTLCREDGLHLLRLTGSADPADVAYGDFALATDAADVDAQAYWYRGRWFDNLGVYWQDFTAAGPLRPRHYATPGSGDHGTLAARVRVPAGGRAAVRFVFAWNVPNCRNYWRAAKPGETPAAPRTEWRNHYATRFADAAATARYALEQWDRLERGTRRFRDALFRSTLPAPVLDAVSANLSVLKSPTCLRLEDGSFYGWEGCHADAGCCEGSCTHVWNYAYALPFLFPALERSMRELDYRHNLLADGSMPFRLPLPLGATHAWKRPCVDGQFGGVLKMYREWKISGDTAWLRRWWPQVRASIAFAWSPANPDRWDPRRTGVVHGRQHHTLDMELFGPNAWLTGFYLAALKAGAEMAEACGEPGTAKTYRALFARGRRWVARHLFNGAYFIQRVNLNDASVLDPYAEDAGVRPTYWSEEHGELKYQVGEGCGIDQVLAQWHADLIGLGEVFERSQVRRALRAICRHNFRPTLRNMVNPCRLYGLDGEAGTTMFAWPKGTRKPVVPVPYAEETMHGFEYQAACHLVMHGSVDEGVAMVKAVRDRYDGARRNPWNEIECGSNYARSMASYALLNAFNGLRFDGVRQSVGFAPVRVPRGGFRCFWSLGTAWGEIELRRAGATLRVLGGELALRTLGLPVTRRPGHVRVTLKGRAVAATLSAGALDFGRALTLPAGSILRVTGLGRSPRSRPRAR